VRVPWLDSH